MDIVNTLKLKSNPKIEINFDGGELSSDSGLFLMKEFLNQIGFYDILKDCLRPHEARHARPPCPSPTPGVHSDSRSSSQ